MKYARELKAIAIGLPMVLSYAGELISSGANYMIMSIRDLLMLIGHANGSTSS